MKIAFTTLHSEDSSGGEARVSYELAEAFSRKNQVLFLHAGTCNQIRQSNKNLIHLEIKSFGSADLAVPYLNVKNIRYIFDTLSAFSPEIIHAHSPDPLSLIAQIWASVNKVPFFSTTHELLTKRGAFGMQEVSKPLAKLVDSKPVQKFFENFFENCDAMIALNKASEKDIRNFGYRGFVFVIPNGRNLKLYSHCRLADLSDNKKRLTFIGWISHRKNQMFLIETLKNLPACFELYLIGKPCGLKYYRSLVTFISQNHLDRVKFVGQVPPAKIPGYLSKSHLFVSASRMEIQSLVVIEALASGTPVVGLSNETIDELVDSSVGRRLPKKATPKDLAHAVLDITSLPQSEYEKLCLNARLKVGELDWTKVVERTQEAYQKVIRHKPKLAERMTQIERNITVFPDQETRSFILKYLNPTINKLKNGKGYQKLKNFSQKTTTPYLYLTIILLLTATGGLTYSLTSWFGKLKKKDRSV